MRGMNGYELIVWDWNGTLLDDFEVVRDIANEMLRRRDLPVMDSHRYREIFGFPVSEYYRQAGFDFEREPFIDLADEFIRAFNARIGDCRLHEEAIEILEALRERGVRQAVLSASRDTSLRDALDHHGIIEYFEAVQGLSDHLAVSKADAGLELLKQLQVDPNSVLMVGDTTHDFDVATKMGVDCVLVASGHQSQKRLEATGARVFLSLDGLRKDWVLYS